MTHSVHPDWVQCRCITQEFGQKLNQWQTKVYVKPYTGAITSCPIDSNFIHVFLVGACSRHGFPTFVWSDFLYIYTLCTQQTIPYVCCSTVLWQLSAIERWSTKWQVKFNPSNCFVVRITRKRDPLIYKYKLMGQTLESVLHYSYLGVEL